MQETWVWSLGQEDSLEKEVATHRRILARRIPWTEEPGGLQSMGSQRAEHDFVTKQENYNMSNSEEMQMLLISNCFFFLIAHLNKGRIWAHYMGNLNKM